MSTSSVNPINSSATSFHVACPVPSQTWKEWVKEKKITWNCDRGRCTGKLATVYFWGLELFSWKQ
ncbi:unnamed protein product [Prunus armeniaca]|uniref:Uncharacterized protein n=1 Tax=Prunus armeniaca TaxID=36596 RepID=A0A6J5X4G9_PRUAR|nr:unnamed protein product [Prunus armeniaca]